MSDDILIGNFVVIYFLISLVIILFFKHSYSISMKIKFNENRIKLYNEDVVDKFNELSNKIEKLKFRVQNPPKYNKIKGYKILNIRVVKNDFLEICLTEFFAPKKIKTITYTYIYTLKDKNNLEFKISESKLSQMIKSNKNNNYEKNY